MPLNSIDSLDSLFCSNGSLFKDDVGHQRRCGAVRNPQVRAMR
jgi:hypothetical protein